MTTHKKTSVKAAIDHSTRPTDPLTMLPLSYGSGSITTWQNVCAPLANVKIPGNSWVVNVQSP